MRDGYKATPLGEIPESWEIKQLSETTNYVDYRGKTPPKVDHGTFLVTAKNIRDGKINYEISKEYVPTELYSDIMSRGKPQISDVLITTEAPLGEVASINNENVALAQRIIKYRGIEGSLINAYLKYALLSPYFQASLDKESTGSTVKGIKGSRLHKLKVLLPPLSEQRKIADILSTVDEKIEAIDQRIAQTQELKKGLMQRLLTKGIGHTRFKDTPLGKIPESWEVKSISEVALINENSLPNSTAPDYCFQYIDLTSVKNGTIQFPQEYIRFSNSPSRARRVIKKGDVIMATVRPNLLGYAYVNFESSDYICSTGFAVITPSNQLDGKYLYQNLYSNSVQSQLSKLLVGSNYPAVNSSDISHLKIPLPSTNEQNKIANILSTVDNKLEVLKDKKTEYQQLKKGLMQQLLTGKMRVKVEEMQS